MSDLITELVLEQKAESNLNYESDFKVLEKKKFQNSAKTIKQYI